MMQIIVWTLNVMSFGQGWLKLRSCNFLPTSESELKVATFNFPLDVERDVHKVVQAVVKQSCAASLSG